MGRKKKRKRRPTHAAGATDDVPSLRGIALLLTEPPTHTLDLHGCTAAQAERQLLGFLRTRAVDAAGRVVHVITGRGNRSEGAPVLWPLVRELVDEDFSPYVSERAGLQGGGGFALRIR